MEPAAATAANEEEDLSAWANDDEAHATAPPTQLGNAATRAVAGLTGSAPSTAYAAQHASHTGMQTVAPHASWLPRHVPPAIATAIEEDLRKFSITAADQATETELQEAIRLGMQRAMGGATRTKSLGRAKMASAAAAATAVNSRGMSAATSTATLSMNRRGNSTATSRDYARSMSAPGRLARADKLGW